MPSQSEQRSGAADVPADELVGLAASPEAFDRKIAEIVAARESAHDRERRAVAAEKIRKELSTREAAVAEREAALEPREARIEKFNRMIATA